MASRYLDGPYKPEPRMPEALLQQIREACANRFNEGSDPEEQARGLDLLVTMTGQDRDDVRAELLGLALAIAEGRVRA